MFLNYEVSLVPHQGTLHNLKHTARDNDFQMCIFLNTAYTIKLRNIDYKITIILI